jgi:hypothetical protein
MTRLMIEMILMVAYSGQGGSIIDFAIKTWILTHNLMVLTMILIHQIVIIETIIKMGEILMDQKE